MQPDPNVLAEAQDLVAKLEARVAEPKRTTWRGPRNLPQPNARKRRRRAVRDARKLNR